MGKSSGMLYTYVILGSYNDQNGYVYVQGVKVKELDYPSAEKC